MTEIVSIEIGSGFESILFSVAFCHWRDSWRPSIHATGHQRSLFIPLPLAKTLFVSLFSFGFNEVETEPLITRPIECARCGEGFESATHRTMHVIRKRCPDIDSEEDVEVVDSLHAMEEVFR